MKQFFFTLLLTFGVLFSLQAQSIVYEDFEGGVADFNWVGLNGAYNGVVANPDPNGNPSGFVGSYTNAPAFDFCFAIGEPVNLPVPFDLEHFNQFKMKIWSPTAPAKALLKFEGPGGPAVEKFIDITVANQWVEYSFDLRAGEHYTNLTKVLVSFNSFVLGDNATYYFDDIVAYRDETVYENFESPSSITWGQINGTFNGAIANPDPTGFNTSATVGSYTNNPAVDFNFAFGTFAQPIDLSTHNQFKLKLWAPAPTQVLLKLENNSGQFVETFRNVVVTNKWQEYLFDFSAGANIQPTKVLIVFSPFVLGSSDTYYFDDLVAAHDPCPGTPRDPEVVDDFDCNRNAVYGGDWGSLSVVHNPAPSPANNSVHVGRFDDPFGSGTEWSNINIENENPFDLSVRNVFSVDVWSPKAGTLLLKLEGGTGSPKELGFPMQPNQWANYKLDLSDQVGKGHKRLVMFFNAGVNGEQGDVYYFDNVKLAAPSELPPLETFENNTVNLGWQAFDQNTVLHGNFFAPTNNPEPGGVNTSASVGCYTKGAAANSILQAFSLTPFALEDYPQFDLDVYSPNNAAGAKVIMQLNSPTQGNKEAEAEITTPGQWETLSFDFSAFDNITDFSEIRLIFNPGVAAAGESWCIDNLRQGKTTVDPCDGVTPNPLIVDDFECQRNYTQVFYGAADLSAINNPVGSAQNGSLKVGEYKDPAGQPFAGIGIEFPAPVDLSLYNHLSVQIYSPIANVPFLFKLEGGQQFEVWDTLPQANAWHKFDIDFSGALGKNNNKLVIFFNAASDQGGQTYYIDNIKWQRAGYNGCVLDFETPGTTLGFRYFANGSLETQGYQFEFIDNPNPTGANTSTKVGKFVKAGDAAPFAGIYTNPDLESPIDWKGVKTVKAKVHMDHIGNFAVKLEGDAVNGAFLEIPVANTKVNEWEELTFNFAAVPDNSEFKRLTLFFDLGIDATGNDVTSYFDDIVIGDGECGSVSVWKPLPLEPMVVSPNPVTDILRVENFRDVARIEVYNLLGQRMTTVNTIGEIISEIDVARFPAGVYTLTGFNRQGVPLGKAKFVKQ